VLSGLKVVVAPVRLARGPAAGMQAFVPTAELAEIHADKVFALAARPYLKPRDVFDLHWLEQHGAAHRCSEQEMRLRLATYPGETAEAWLAKAFARKLEMRGAVVAVGTDLRRWLPSSWPMDDERAKEMIDASVTAREQGITAMGQVRDRGRDGPTL
jgi:hypothetical protein